MNDRKKIYLKSLVYLLPTILFCCFFYFDSLSFGIHDFGNSYFPARLLHEGVSPGSVIFDIYDFNKHVWTLGYEEVLLDFYFNSPFTLTAFYPLAYIDDPYIAKNIFNAINIIVLLFSIQLLTRIYKVKLHWGLIFIPFLFYIPIKNGILYGQSYILILFLVVYGYYYIEKQKHYSGTALLGFGALLKFFPVFYGIPMLFSKKWKTIVIGIIVTLGMIIIGAINGGMLLWEQFFFEIIPNGFSSGNVMDFRLNSQSFDVFFKSLFIQDSYYNPDAIFNSPRGYRISIWIVKSIILGITLQLSWVKRKNLFLLLCIWVTALFLLQSKTASYAQILWIIPAFYIYSSSIHIQYKILFYGFLFFVCNLPITLLHNFPFFFKFSRLWLSIGMVFIVYKSMNVKIDWRYIVMTLVVLLPLNMKIFNGEVADKASYVLEEKNHFMIYDFQNEEGYLKYGALGRNGDEEIKTNILIHGFEPSRCSLIDNQIFVDGQQLTDTPELKKKPVLINNCEVYYLGDRLSRRGAFTLKKINICP